MSTLQPSPFANPVNPLQPGVLSEYPNSGMVVPMNMSQLTPGMQAIAAYRARGGLPLGGGGMVALGNSMGVQGGGATPGGIANAQAAAAQRSPMPQTQASPYGAAQQAMNSPRGTVGPMGEIRPPAGYQSSNPGGVQTLGSTTTMSGLGVRTQGPPNARGMGVGTIRPPSRMAYNSRF